MSGPNRFPVLIPLFAVLFAGIHLAYEHFSGGVASHHPLADPDLPAISNWYGLITLPILGLILAYRAQSPTGSSRWAGIPVPILAGFLGALFYGLFLAISFLLGAEGLARIAFLSLFVIGVFLPIYRIEYLAGFAAGMTVAVGGVLPVIVGLVVGVASFIIRFIIRKSMALFRRSNVRTNE